MQLRYINIAKLRSHERAASARIKKIIRLITRRQQIKPILVDRKFLVVLDGHHRVAAFRRLGLKKIPALLVDYDREVRVTLRRNSLLMKLIKFAVVQTALVGRHFPSKTTRHLLKSKIRNSPVSIVPTRGSCGP